MMSKTMISFHSLSVPRDWSSPQEMDSRVQVSPMTKKSFRIAFNRLLDLWTIWGLCAQTPKTMFQRKKMYIATLMT